MPGFLKASVCPRCRRFVPLGRCDICLAHDESFAVGAIELSDPSSDGLIEPLMPGTTAVIPERHNPHTADAAPGGMPVAATPGRLIWFTHLSGVLAPLYIE